MQEILSELTIEDVRELVNSRKVTVSSTDNSAMTVHMKDVVMIADPDAGTDGKITLLDPNTGCALELDSNNIIESIHGNKNFIAIRLSQDLGALDIAITGEKPCLIHPMDKKFDCKEPVYKDFVSREDFINRTGIFVTPEYFEYIYDIEFRKANVSVDEFVNDYEEKYSTCIQEVPLNGTFKYEITDEDLSCMYLYDDGYEPNLWEIINSLAISYNTEYQSKWEIVEKYRAALEDNLRTLNEIKAELSNKA